MKLDIKCRYCLQEPGTYIVAKLRKDERVEFQVYCKFCCDNYSHTLKRGPLEHAVEDMIKAEFQDKYEACDENIRKAIAEGRS